MKGNKFLAAALAASMVFSTVPATALSVFADSVSVEASDIQASTDDQVVVVASTGSKSDPTTLALVKKLLTSAAKTGITTDTAGSDAIVSAIQGLIGGDKLNNADPGVAIDSSDKGTVTNIKVDGEDVSSSSQLTASTKSLSFSIAYADDEAYDVTITADDSSVLTDANKKAALDALFASTTFTREQGVTPTSASVVKQIQALKTANSDGSWTTDTGIYSALASSTFATNGGQLTANSDGTYSGKITVDNKTYTIKSAHFTEVDPAALSNAIAAIKNNVYANPQSSTPDDVTGLNGKIKADLDEAAGISLNANITGGTTIAASARNNWTGSYTVNIGGTAVTFTLKKDSTTKSTETEDAIKGVLNGTPGKVSHKLYTKEGTKYSNELKNASIIEVPATSSLSLGIQPLTATAATKADDVTAAVKAAIEAKLPDNGVTVEVTTLKDFADASDATTTTATATSTDSTAAAAGYDYVLVSTTIANDYYGWTDGTDADTDKTENTVKNYVVKVSLPKLKANKTTALEMADANYVSKGDYTYANKATNGDGKVVTVDYDVDLYDLTGLVTKTPSDSNDTLTYAVTDKDGDATTGAAVQFTKVAYAAGTPETAGETLYDADGKEVDNFTSTAGKLLVYTPGTYKVTVTGSDSTVKATATIVVSSKFNDVSATAYYANAVNNAYKLGVTNGVSNTEFGVNKNVTRAQFVTWLYNYAVSQDEDVAISDDDVKSVFSDVATTAYYAKAVQWASENGVASGVGNDRFDPNAEVTRAQAVTFIYRALGQPQTGATGEEGENTTQFTDVNGSAYYMPAVTWGVNNGIVSGLSTTTFAPGKNATRAQGITFIARAYGFYH